MSSGGLQAYKNKAYADAVVVQYVRGEVTLEISNEEPCNRSRNVRIRREDRCTKINTTSRSHNERWIGRLTTSLLPIGPENTFCASLGSIR